MKKLMLFLLPLSLMLGCGDDGDGTEAGGDNDPTKAVAPGAEGAMTPGEGGGEGEGGEGEGEGEGGGEAAGGEGEGGGEAKEGE